jgi:protein tyrosine phosphatase
VFALLRSIGIDAQCACGQLSCIVLFDRLHRQRPPGVVLAWRTRELTHSRTHSQRVLPTCHLLCRYTAWPDHGVPNSTSELISFRKEIRKLHPHPAPPMVVHCSAGVGRTGTFVVVDNVMNQAEHLVKDLDIKSAVKELRACRNFMVQTIVQ